MADKKTEERRLEEARELARQVKAIVEVNPGADLDNVRHTLLLLKLTPTERLSRALIRGRLLKHANNLGMCSRSR